ncbi:MAG: hypothetical protein ACLRZZ_18415 [Enterocloster sp.]
MVHSTVHSTADSAADDDFVTAFAQPFSGSGIRNLEKAAKKVQKRTRNLKKVLAISRDI